MAKCIYQYAIFVSIETVQTEQRDPFPNAAKNEPIENGLAR